MSKLKIKTGDDQRFVDALKEVRADFKAARVKAYQFDMASFASSACKVGTDLCGTSHCIGGWVDIKLGGSGDSNPIETLDVSEAIETAAYVLFFPENNWAFNHSKRKHAIKAIDNFLAGHKDPWRGVKKED